MVRKSGITDRHTFPISDGQRVWNTQPAGRSSGEGMSPGTGVSGASRSDSRGSASSSPLV